jgi:DNA/RNA endonuclease G (NUC1)
MMPNNDVRGTKYTNFAVPVSTIEAKTNINFFPNMPVKYKQAKTFINTDLVNFK